MSKSVDFESVLSLIDSAISPTYLNPTQEIVLREVWNGKTYNKMAYDYNYDPEYIKTVGCNLWQTLSRAFDEQINKSNFVPFMRRKISHLLTETAERSLEKTLALSVAEAERPDKPKLCNWATAPKIRHFVGREAEIATLRSWNDSSNCRLVVVSGAVGCGKTTLATKFANTVKHEFDCVIWFSLSQPPSLGELLNKYLLIIDGSYELQDTKPQELSFLLSEFIDCLRRQKILLILDGLQHILEIDRTSTTYKQKYEAYGQFLRSVISTNHQSLMIVTSRIKPKLLRYYATDQVKFLDLQGFEAETAREFIRSDLKCSSIDESELLQLSNKLHHNPQLLKIANNHLDIFIEEDKEQAMLDFSLLQPVSELLEQELIYLSGLEKEIIYWLSISCYPLSVSQLGKYLENSQPRVKFVTSIRSLLERSLIIEQDKTYSLMPIMKVYLRRRLVKKAL